MKKFKKPIFITRPVMVDLDELREKLQEVWNSGWLTNNGYKHQEFETIISNKIFDGLSTSLVSNATMGLLFALKVLDITGEVITTPFTFPATVHAISWCGLTPVFCDIDAETMNIDPDKIEKLITKKTSAILAVHAFGVPCNIKKIEDIAKKHKLRVIYDAAHAFELEINGKSIANYGDASIFSFHATKLFHTAEGGAIVFKTRSAKKRCDIVKNFGIKGENVIECGINGKMNELQASVGLLMMKEKKEERRSRKIIEDIYNRELRGVKGLTLPKIVPGITKKSLQYFVIRINEKKFGKSRNDLFEDLKKYNVFARQYFYPLCSNFKFYKELSSARKEKLPIANKIVNETIALPFYGGISPDDAKNICEIIKYIQQNDI